MRDAVSLGAVPQRSERLCHRHARRGARLYPRPGGSSTVAGAAKSSTRSGGKGADARQRPVCLLSCRERASNLSKEQSGGGKRRWERRRQRPDCLLCSRRLGGRGVIGAHVRWPVIRESASQPRIATRSRKPHVGKPQPSAPCRHDGGVAHFANQGQGQGRARGQGQSSGRGRAGAGRADQALSLDNRPRAGGERRGGGRLISTHY